MTELTDEGSVCQECPHPLSEHELQVLEQVTLLVCKTPEELCRCVVEHQHEVPPLNQEAIKALGAKNGEGHAGRP